MSNNSNLVEVMSYPFNVDSSQRSAGTNESPTFNTSQVISLMAKKGVFQLYFTSIQVPFTFYQFANYYNTALTYVPLTCTLYDGTTTKAALQLQIPQGNYTAYSIITALNTALSSLWIVQGLNGTPVFTTTYNPATGFITYGFTNATYTSSFIAINFTSQGTGYYYAAGYFGINTNSPTPITFYANGTTMTSTQPCVLNPINYLLVHSNLKQQRSREFITTQDTVSTIVVKIPITTQQSSWINYFQNTEPIFLLDPIISSINFTLTTNISSNVINLQNINWSFSFILREVLRPDYESILTSTSNNLMTPIHMVDEAAMNRLLEERQRMVERLQFYKKKLTNGGVTPEGMEKPDSDQDVLPDTERKVRQPVQQASTESISGGDDKGQSEDQGQARGHDFEPPGVRQFGRSGARDEKRGNERLSWADYWRTHPQEVPVRENHRNARRTGRE